MLLLDLTGVRDWLNAASTVVVAVFAVVQVWLVALERRERVGAAFNVVWGEWNRLLQVDSQWARQDLIALTNAGVLSPEDVLLTDWPFLSENLAKLGGDAARYGGAARVYSNIALADARLLIHMAGLKPAAERNEQDIRSLRAIEHAIKDRLHQSFLLLDDAISVAPAWLRKQTVNPGSPQSEFGKLMVAKMQAQGEHSRHHG